MSDTINQSLAHVHTLIEAGKLSEARVVLEPMLEKDVDNADVWWVYVHAVEDPDDAQTALDNVLRIDPNYPGASKLMAALIQQNATEADVDSDWDEDDDDLPDDDFADDLPDIAGKRTLLTRVGGLVIAILLVFVIIIIAGSLGGNNDEKTPTPDTTIIPQTARQSTPVTMIAPDNTPDVEPTAPVQSDAQLIASALGSFELLGNSPTTMSETNLGQTLSVSVCVVAEALPRDVLDSAMIALSGVVAEIDPAIEALAVQLMDCNTAQAYNTIGVLRTDVEAFLDGELTKEQFAAQWEPLR